MKDTNTPTCKLCLNDINAAHGNTTNLLSNFKNYHPEQYQEVKPLILKMINHRLPLRTV